MDHIIKNSTKINNTIIISPPQCGKTTLLRDIVRNLSNGTEKYNFKGVNVALIDERNEIAGSYLGIPQMDVNRFNNIKIVLNVIFNTFNKYKYYKQERRIR